MYKASKQLEQAILELAPPFTEHGTICQNWPELRAWHQSTGHQYTFKRFWGQSLVPIVVHTAGTELMHNIFSSRSVHLAFRAWHDYNHIVLDADFSNAGEHRVACHHIKQLRLLNVPRIDRRAIWAFVAGEVAHYWKHRQFIDYKREFVSHSLRFGVNHAIENCWAYQ